jgi:SAM-dependent methyltransferase
MPEGKGKGGSDRQAGWRRPPRRAVAVTRIADLRPTDRVLDVGCAEGLVALEVASHVERLHGLDVHPARVRRAAERAAQRGIRNASFEATPVQDFSLEPRSWDVTLFMRVWGKGGDGGRNVGRAEFERLLEATRRQAIVQAGKLRSERGLRHVFEICDAHGFDVAWFVRYHLVVANRRGAGARIGALPERVLVRTPSGPQVVPAEELDDHPILRSFDPERRAAA